MVDNAVGGGPGPAGASYGELPDTPHCLDLLQPEPADPDVLDRYQYNGWSDAPGHPIHAGLGEGESGTNANDHHFECFHPGRVEHRERVQFREWRLLCLEYFRDT